MRFSEDILPLQQHCITVLIALGLLEMVFWYLDYANFNSTGMRLGDIYAYSGEVDEENEVSSMSDRGEARWEGRESFLLSPTMPPPPPSRPSLNGNTGHHHQPPLPPPPSRPSLNGHTGHHVPPPPSHTARHQQPYYRSYSSSSSSASLKGCCCCLFLLFAFLALLVLAIVLIVILAVKPKKPQFDLQQVAVMNMGITSLDNPNPSVLDPTTASLSFTIRMLFTAGNPNKVGIRYGESSFTVLYKGLPLGRATVAGFYQDAHSTRNVEATIAVDRVNLMQGNAADLVRDASLNDRVELTVRGDVSAKIRVMNFDSPGVQVSVNCGIGISPRKQALIYKQCGFDGLSV
ncbi:hypothetical protein F2Q70_00018074 [Brassica cretica]|uniref:Late embryogenesis abundant protein LEA-2 subgroup domain-containing protein n=1 Tax=Brassica cretica TaxID=69181 RepID=A0A8S9HYE5_BRACR|nr:hypothetical protein F2Q70_00018074 [Brassica cretica]